LGYNEFFDYNQFNKGLIEQGIRKTQWTQEYLDKKYPKKKR